MRKHTAFFLSILLTTSLIGCGAKQSTDNANSGASASESSHVESSAAEEASSESAQAEPPVTDSEESAQEDAVSSATSTETEGSAPQNNNGAPSESANRIMGTVSAIDDNSITVQTDAGEEQTISLSEDTTYSKGGFGGGSAPGGNGGTAPTAPGGDSNSTPPAKPDGEDNNAPGSDQMNGENQGNNGQANGTAPDGDGGTAPTAPDGNGQAGESAPQMPSSEEITLDDIAVGDSVMIELAEDGSAKTVTLPGDSMQSMGGPGMGGPGMGGGASVTYSAVNEYTEDTEISDETFSSTGSDEEAILVSGDCSVTLNNITVDRTSDDSTGGDNSSFYGVGAAILGTSGTTTISGAEITTDSAGAAGVFAYGDAIIRISDSNISTSQGTSGGIHAAGGGTLYADNVTAVTQGASSAAIRSDRGGGTMVVDGGSYTSNGSGSPAIYSTADIAVNDADLTANGSEAICIEGLNSIHLFDCDLAGNMPENEQNDCTWNVILYQSMSGDSEIGNSTFEMVGGTLSAGNGGMFYTTNTESTFILNDVDITYAEDNDFFLKCTGNSNQRGWGSSGQNGADCNFTAIAQEMNGDVIWDSISTLNMYITDGSALTGAVINDESSAGNGGDGSSTLYIDDTSSWTVTSDSILSSLFCSGTIQDSEGKTVAIIGTDGTVYVDGDSAYTITVENYSDTCDVSGASATTAFADYTE